MSAWVGVDVGGTFTDIAVADERGRVQVGKVLTTPGEEHRGVVGGLDVAGVELADVRMLVHGTTIVINALLERKGATVGLVTTRGFRDTHELGRSSRPQSFNWFYRRDPVLVPRERRFELDERTRADGHVETTPGAGEVDELVERLRSAGVDAVAVAFLNSYIGPANELAVAEMLRRRMPDAFVTTSSELSRAWREYERFTTAAANAYVGPAVEDYLAELETQVQAAGLDGDFVMMDSTGGALRLDNARRYPVRLIESGPVGGALGAARLAAECGLERIVTFDMGGTTAKSTFIDDDATFPLSELYWTGGYETGFPLQIPSVDIVEVGSGGGSIAWLDDTGRLRVGPRSAGAMPGPACYGRGGEHVTVTDANVYTGRLAAEHFIGSIALDAEASAAVVERLAERLEMAPMRLALGVINLANLAMANVVRQQTLGRGRDPRDFTLVAFGGAGPLHACDVAAEVGVSRVLIPPAPGHFSAIGMLAASPRFDRHEVFEASLEELDVARLQATLREIASDLAAVVDDRGDGWPLRFSYSLAMRFAGQEHTLTIRGPGDAIELVPDLRSELTERFIEEYRARFGHADTSTDIEVVELIVEVSQELAVPEAWSYEPTAQGRRDHAEAYFTSDERPHATTILPRSGLLVGEPVAGPVLVYEEGTTTVVPPEATAVALANGCLQIDLGGAS